MYRQFYLCSIKDKPMTDLTTPKGHKIIIPVDFSASSFHAMEYAIHMAKELDDDILLIYVLNENRFASILTGSDTKRLIKNGIETKLSEYKARIIELWPEANVEAKILEGKPYREIERCTEEDNVDMVVMGTNGETGIEKFVGSTTRRVMSSSHVPVITVKEKVDVPKFDTIVLPLDLTKSSKQKVAWAIRIAKRFDSTVHVISEVQKDEFLKNKIEKNLNQVKKVLTENGIKNVCKLLDDLEYPEHLGKDTIKYAYHVDADLIIIMTQQESKGLSQIFIGNYAEQIANSCDKTPVMSINPRKTTYTEGTGVGFY